MASINVMSGQTPSADCLDMDLVMKLFLSKMKISLIMDYLGLHIKQLSSDVCQRQLLEATVDHQLMAKYPVSLKYRQVFAKQLIQLLERHDLNVCETVSESNALLQSDTDLNKSHYNLNYLSYILNDKQIITLQESDNLVIEGTTGLRSWSAAKHLAKFVECNPLLVNGKSVLELGSGIGLTGIYILKTCCPRLLSFSDHHSVVLEVLEKNIQMNNVSQNSVVYNIDWEQIESLDNYLKHYCPDVIIAADVMRYNY